MAEEDPSLATRAPESDLHDSAADPSLGLPSSSIAHPPLSEHCTTSAPTPAHHADSTPGGHIGKFNARSTAAIAAPSLPDEIEAYISTPSDYPTTPAKLLLLLSNGAGHRSINNQLQADLFARQGYLTIMPDLFADDPAPNSQLASESEDNASWLESVKLKVAETAKAFSLDMWLARQTREKVLPRLQSVLAGVSNEYADAAGRGLYIVGYCLGGKYALILGGNDTTPTDLPVKCLVCAHGALVEATDVESVKTPVCLIGVENDPLFPGEILEAGKKQWHETAVEHEVNVYPGVPHGFAVLGNYGSEHIARAQKQAFEQTLKWLEAH